MFDLKGSIVRIYMKSGKVFSGVVKYWGDSYIELLHNEEITVIKNPQSIDAYTVNLKTKVNVVDNEIIAKTVEQKMETVKVNAEQERETVKEFLLSDSPKSDNISYGNQLSILRKIKDNSKK